MRKNRKNPNDIFGLDEILDAWMTHMLRPQLDTIARRPRDNPSYKWDSNGGIKRDSMSYEERDSDIVFTIDMPGVEKKDIDINVEEHSISVKAEKEGKRKYNYSRKFKPAVDVDSAKATFKNGVLDITLSKAEEVPKGKSVKIK